MCLGRPLISPFTPAASSSRASVAIASATYSWRSTRRSSSICASPAAAREGARLCEGVLSVGRDFTDLPRLLDRGDPQGAVAAAMVTAEDTTCLAALVGR